MTCLVNSNNERDSCLLNRLFRDVSQKDSLLRGTSGFEPHEKEQKQVSDVRGRTRNTMKAAACAFFPWPRGPGNPMKRLCAGDCNWPLEQGIPSWLESLTRAD
ncbi:hypothetical protein NPIL_598051 [Nephila pilipes]|uniref:Uncharacterized protein n=1 Tax=Nephila pilipes TaxID=299642 RepID=A0A8X6TX58_NEPPI|nr:hypothetical protein NPIL_598051 [Nephila pilipes]